MSKRKITFEVIYSDKDMSQALLAHHKWFYGDAPEGYHWETSWLHSSEPTVKAVPDPEPKDEPKGE